MRSRIFITRYVNGTASIVLTVLFAVTSFNGCGTDDTRSTYGELTVLAGRSNEFTAYTDSAVTNGSNLLIVSGLIGDMPGLSDAVNNLLMESPVAGRITNVPRANVNAIRLGQRAPGGDMNTMFGPSTPPAYRDVVTALQLMADSSDVLLVVTDQTEDVGHTIFYGADAPATTAKLAQDIADRINTALPELRRATGIDYDDIYALRSGSTGSFVAWASGRSKPSLALELALFGGRDGSPPKDEQTAFAQFCLATAMVELGVLDDRAIARAPIEAPPVPAILAFPEGSGLRYLLNGAARLHVPGELLSLPSDAVLRIEGFVGQRFDGVTVDIHGVGDEDDVGEEFTLGDLHSGDYLLEFTYRRDTTVIWRELATVGEGAEEPFILQDSLGTNPWISSFPAPETWLYLNARSSDDGVTPLVASNIPNTVRLVREKDRSVHGTDALIRLYRLVINDTTIGRMFSTKWTAGTETSDDADLVDVIDLGAERGLSPGIAVEMRYATTDNFLDADVYDGMNRCLLSRDVAEALIRVQKNLSKRGLGLKVFDCLRPHAVQYRMWELRPEPGYVARPEPGSNHNRGAAVDLTLVDERGVELGMPTEFDSFTKRAWHDATEGLSPSQIENRVLLRNEMRFEGFSSIRKEWWHYNGPEYRSFTRNLDVNLDAGYGRMQFPHEWKQ
jgi:zinc D-Ala-D-Ala dipeptidase